MKKKIIKIGILSLLSLGSISTLNSCRDAIDIVQDGEVNDSVFFTSVDNLQRFLIGDVYTRVDNSYGIHASALITDEYKVGSSNGGAYSVEFRHLFDSNSDLVSDIWLQNYQLINRANRLLEGAQRVTPSSSEVATYNNILAQARVLRALAYLQLETFFSEDMTNDNALGVMILNGVPSISTKLPRSTNAEVYAVIESDLAFAEQYLEQNSRYYASINLVNAIRARLSLYRGDYANAKTHAQNVINNSGLSLTQAGSFTAAEVGTDAWNTSFYADASSSPYRQIWSDNSQGEVLFALARPVTGGSYTHYPALVSNNNSSLSGNPRWVMGLNLFNTLNSYTNDIRRYAYIDPSSSSNDNIYVIDKYPGKGTATLRNDVKVFRLSEMYLILAEASAEEGNLTAAANYIGQIRTARTYLGTATTPTYSSKQEALLDILKERRVELAFEGHRYIDLKRMAARAGTTMDRNSSDSDVQITNLDNSSYRYTLPIPLSEISGNPNIQQNRGY